jgi:Fe2+ or Zn2+ uptake regulation protein
MVTFRGILLMGEMLRKNPNRYLSLKQLTDLLVDNSGSFHSKTIRNYLIILEKHGFIRSVAVDGVPMWEILQSGEKEE